MLPATTCTDFCERVHINCLNCFYALQFVIIVWELIQLEKLSVEMRRTSFALISKKSALLLCFTLQNNRFRELIHLEKWSVECGASFLRKCLQYFNSQQIEIIVLCFHTTENDQSNRRIFLFSYHRSVYSTFILYPSKSSFCEFIQLEAHLLGFQLLTNVRLAESASGSPTGGARTRESEKESPTRGVWLGESDRRGQNSPTRRVRIRESDWGCLDGGIRLGKSESVIYIYVIHTRLHTCYVLYVIHLCATHLWSFFWYIYVVHTYRMWYMHVIDTSNRHMNYTTNRWHRYQISVSLYIYAVFLHNGLLIVSKIDNSGSFRKLSTSAIWA